MKKVLGICMTLVIAMSMSLGVFAAPNGFVSSPTGTAAPKLEAAVDAEGKAVELILTPYSDRSTLSEDALAKFDKAYNDITSAADLTKLNAEIGEVAAQKNIAAGDLAVSDLFDLSYSDGSQGSVSITLTAETLSKFVGLLHFNGEKWDLVKDAKVENGKLTFSVDSLSPFAIVVNTSNGNTEAPATGDSMPSYLILIMAVSALALVVLVRKSKQQAA